MKMESGKYHGCELSEVPTDYLEWALGRVSGSEEMQQAMTAEVSRRNHKAAVDNQSPLERVAERASEAVTKFAAKHGH